MHGESMSRGSVMRSPVLVGLLLVSAVVACLAQSNAAQGRRVIKST